MGQLQSADTNVAEQSGQSAEHALKYLTRFLSGGPISDHWILSTPTTHVTFLVRQGETVGVDEQQVPMTLTHWNLLDAGVCTFCQLVIPEPVVSAVGVTLGVKF